VVRSSQAIKNSHISAIIEQHFFFFFEQHYKYFPPHPDDVGMRWREPSENAGVRGPREGGAYAAGPGPLP
jgi:hypothetical protein